jgi:hypothetical protein
MEMSSETHVKFTETHGKLTRPTGSSKYRAKSA